jgi:hypothetical protein
VPIRMNIRSSYNQLRRRYRAIRARLRRARVAIGMLAVLMLALGEPLLCIVHCQIWIPFAYQSYFSTQHAHMHHTSSDAMMSAETVAARSAASVAAPLPPGDPSCFMPRADGNHTGAPFHVPPSPVHDVLPTLVMLIMLVLLTSTRLAAALRDPPDTLLPLLLRPPISFAV